MGSHYYSGKPQTGLPTSASHSTASQTAPELGRGAVAAIYHPDAGEGADAYEVKNTFFECERRDAF